MKIAVIAPTRYPISEPFAGGLEAFCSLLVHGLREAGHQVDLFASRGSQGHVREYEFPGVDWSGQEELATDHTYPQGHQAAEDEAVERLLGHLLREGYDLIHNNSLHAAIFQIADRIPLLTTLHCPPVAAMQEAIALPGREVGSFAAVSHSTAAEWQLPEAPRVIPNAFNGTTFRPGPGGGGAVWFGRLIKDKGPHLAIDAARHAGMPLTLLGQPRDLRFFREELLPRDGSDLTWLGGCTHEQLAEVIGRSSVCLVTPLWREPFGLVTIEAMACGTPVAAFANGGTAETLRHAPGRLVPAGDVPALAAAAREASLINRDEVAHYVRENFSLERMIDRYLSLYRSVRRQEVLAR
ncbi:D-inositol 3-phosphate glycosyltransferase [Corynebacterium occultum]|uniref:D-inositol 3-phosphate glycosyltransferase n=1 Tax=Corynebacterium occultum TaxID=2675219 RepID=A0A6B8W3M6_9CORY|nr:glycosyltransferase [Corynebacterium occultum]QGU07141.1 D-inositol 3-phosphate glycosyltransferase [Corynebacterium occultum]